jgi:hypothetical protein
MLQLMSQNYLFTKSKHVFIFMGVIACLVVSGCATEITEKPSVITRATTPLGQFEQVILVKSKIADKYASSGANIKAANKIDEHLENGLRALFNKLEVKNESELDAANLTAALAKSDSKVLLIKPFIKQIKFIGGAARFWAGAMAGSSVVVMDVAYIDAASSKQLSAPGFQRVASAWSGPFGIADNRMLADVAQDVVNYTAMNK